MDDDRRTRVDDAQPLYRAKLAANQIAWVRLVMTTAIRYPAAAGLPSSSVVLR